MENKYIILGVADKWLLRKGYDIFIELSKIIEDTFQIVMVGDNKSITEKPNNILFINRTSDQKELADIYSSADVFFNPTREEVFGMVNIEALACGTPVVTFDTGGSPECIDSTCGIVLKSENIEYIYNILLKIRNDHLFNTSDCVRRAYNFKKENVYSKYVDLYLEILKEKGE